MDDSTIPIVIIGLCLGAPLCIPSPLPSSGMRGRVGDDASLMVYCILVKATASDPLSKVRLLSVSKEESGA